MVSGPATTTPHSADRWAALPAVALAMLASGPASGQNGPWTWREADHLLQIGHGEGAEGFQCGALHLDSGYLRLVPAPDAGWGTSVVLVPAFWAAGTYHQGTPVTVESIEVVEGDVVLRLLGKVEALQVQLAVTVHPPGGGTIRADIEARTEGTVQLDDRPREAFKPLMLSSMRISATQWDAQAVVTDGAEHAIPAEGWMLAEPLTTRTFGLRGGDSEWKPRAPTVLIQWPQPVTVAGWVTPSNDPNDDNLGLWAASDEGLAEWHGTIVVRTADANGATVTP